MVPGVAGLPACLLRRVTDRICGMTYVITSACVDVKHKACAAE